MTIPVVRIALLIFGLSNIAISQVLVLTHDTTNVTEPNRTRRLADRDTLFTHLPGLIQSGYTHRTFDSSSTFSDLSSFQTLIIQETAFDPLLLRWLGQTARTQIIDWLNGGSPTSKRFLLHIGGDLGYNYERAASPARDTIFSRMTGGYTFARDNGPTAYSDRGVNKISDGTKDSLNSAPPGSGFFPDGVRAVNGATQLYRYSGYQSSSDTVACVVRETANYTFVSLFTDPRYYPGTGGTPPNPYSGFRRVLIDVLQYVTTGVEQEPSEQPLSYALSQNFPNPFNPSTKITLSVPEKSDVQLVIYNILGQEVRTLFNGQMNRGVATVEWDGRDDRGHQLASGIYMYRMVTGAFIQSRKMLLLK